MMGHKTCFYEEIWVIIPKLSLLPLLIWSAELQLQITLVFQDNPGMILISQPKDILRPFNQKIFCDLSTKRYFVTSH